MSFTSPTCNMPLSLHVKYFPTVNSLEIIWSSFVLSILIKNAKMLLLLLPVYVSCIENPENQNSEIAANTGEVSTLLKLVKLLIWICILRTVLP